MMSWQRHETEKKPVLYSDERVKIIIISYPLPGLWDNTVKQVKHVPAFIIPVNPASWIWYPLAPKKGLYDLKSLIWQISFSFETKRQK